MFFYVCLIVLPATALTQCSVGTIWDYFKVLDTNNDNGIDWNEVSAIFGAVDLNNDTFITLREAQLALPYAAPILSGKEQEIIYFLDLDGDGKISLVDAAESYRLIDKNKDGIKSREEYSPYIEKRCGTV